MPDEQKQLNPYQRIVEQAFVQAVPLNCQIEITYRCNHLCTFCYNAPTGEPEMSTEQLFEALRKVSDFGVLYVTLTGGEPLVHKDFFKIASEVRRLGMALRVYSNAYLLADPERVRRLKALKPIEVEISIHGSRAETHEALTGIKGSFDRLMQALGNLQEAGLKVNLKCPITKLNQEELFEIREIGDRFGCRPTFDAVITPKDDGSSDPLALRAEDHFLEKYWGEWYGDLHKGVPPPLPEGCSSEGYVTCGAGRSSFNIDPYGNILPCVALRRKIANILEIDSLKEIWEASPVLSEVRELSISARKMLDKHENAKYLTFCMGTAETQTGNPLALYPQAELNAAGIKRHYEQLEKKEREEGANSA
jgi:radical SAM protein with 4Fe4S-binding SPASM domain